MSDDRRYPPGGGIPFDMGAARKVTCPVCDAAPGEYCVSLRDRRPADRSRSTGWVHIDRVITSAGYDPDDLRDPEDQ